MKKLLYYLPFLLLLVSCGSDGGSEEPQVAPKLLSSSITNGATGVSHQTTQLVLTYDQKIWHVSSGALAITLNGEQIAQSSLKWNDARTELTIGNMQLEYATSYTLLVPQGAMLSYEARVPADECSIKFTTEARPTIESLCTENPSAQAVNVFNFLKENYGQKVLSATMANVNWNFAEAELVYVATGKYPAIATMDYIHMFTPTTDNTGWKVDYANTTEVEAWWNNGGLLSAGWHWMVPTTESAVGTSSVTYDPEETTFRVNKALTEGTWENTQMKSDLVKMATLLKALQTKNIPLIWRPLHEAAGNTYEYTGGKAWFWWGYDGAEAYVSLWRYMFNYFKAEGINNLIWVWTTQGKDGAFYPGDEYVDIVGCDIYNKTVSGDCAKRYEEIVASYPQKLVTLSECGNVAKISDQWSSGAHWSYFMPWYEYNATSLDAHGHANAEWWQNAMDQEFVLDRASLPSLK